MSNNSFWLVIHYDGHAVVRAPTHTAAVETGGFSGRTLIKCLRLDVDALDVPVSPDANSTWHPECIMRVARG